MKRCIPSLIMCVALVALASSSQAAMISLNINPVYGSTENTGATALLEFSFAEAGPKDLLVVSIYNTTPTSISSRLTAVGFEWPSSLSLPSSFANGGKSSYFDELDFNVNVSPGKLNAPDGFDVMISSDGNFEGGSTKHAPASGEMQRVILNLGNTGLTPDQLSATLGEWYANLDGIAGVARFQAIDRGLSDKVVSQVYIPEPATALLMGLPLIALRSRRHADKHS